MDFPVPPPLKPKPSRPRPFEGTIRRPEAARRIMYISMLSWAAIFFVVSLPIVWLFVWPWLSHAVSQPIVVAVVMSLVCAAMGYLFGSWLGKLVIVDHLKSEASPFYSALVVRALEQASQWHIGQWRKHPTEQIPYIAHPAAVGLLLQRAGWDDETIAAGILHDVIEDCGVTREELALASTPRVAELVDWVSDARGLSWAERKKVYCTRLAQAPLEALAIASADHLCNLRSIMQAVPSSRDIWSVFHAGRTEKIAHEYEVLQTVQQRLRGPLVDAFARALSDVEHLPT